MDKIGLDFGTTNSIVCRYDPKNESMNFLHFGAGKLDFFPTAIAYRENGDKRFIGAAAGQYRFSSGYDFYENFKLSLGRNAEQKNGRKRSPKEVTEDFLREVIRSCLKNALDSSK